MATVSLGAQAFDLAFHPTNCTAYTCTMSGQVKAISYDHHGRTKEAFTTTVSQRSCRGLSVDEDGSRVYVVGKGKGIHTIDTTSGKVTESRTKAHDSPINRVKHLTPWLMSTGDDDGVITLWDPRKKDSIRKYTQHFDYITDFLWLEDKKQLVATSGDGSLSVMDVRAKTTKPLAHSEDQEDELLCIAAIKGASKVVVGTQTGVLSIFNRSSGWADCVDRIPGHPQSVDTLCSLPESFSDVDASTTLLSGSSDGIVRMVQVFPTKLLGVVADHGEWPIECVAVGEGEPCLSLDQGQDEDEFASSSVNAKEGENDEDEDKDGRGRWWVGSVGHDETLRLTSLRSFFRLGRDNVDEADRASSADNREYGACQGDEADDGDSDEEQEAGEAKTEAESDDEDASDNSSSSDSDEGDAPTKKRKMKPEKNPLAVKRKRGKNEVDVQGQFFDEL